MRARDVKVGMRVFWNDPDPDGNSGWGKVVKMQTDEKGRCFSDAVISLKMEDEGEVGCYARELSLVATQNY
jgi:hypothetical protein